MVTGTIERKDLIQNLINKELGNDINDNKTELMIKLMILAAIYEFMYMHKVPIKVVISEYLKVSDFFVNDSGKKFLNAILDKASKVSRINKNWKPIIHIFVEVYCKDSSCLLSYFLAISVSLILINFNKWLIY